MAPLETSDALVLAAAAHSIDQASVHTISHTGSDGSDVESRIAETGFEAQTWGENVAAGYTEPAAVVDDWMESEGHRDNILNPDFSHVGVASAQADDGTIYWTMLLAG